MAIGTDVNLGAVKGHPVPPPDEVATVAQVVFENVVARNLTCCHGCVDYGCDPKHRAAGWLQAGSEQKGGIYNLTLRNISILAAGGASLSTLGWVCTNGSLHGVAAEISPALAATCMSTQG